MKNKNVDDTIEKLNALLTNSVISDQERTILSLTQSKLEPGENYDFEMVKLRNNLLPLVVSSQLSKDVLAFYKDIRAERKVSWGEGSSLLTGLSTLPKK
ncbi:bacteriocin immunity protein [Lactococcus lactis]|uniref:bacteriocin immunity protein n=1 Tax=Lactococcus lactis TaxID=1358 RepID=UPI0012940211|nr:bacteriocin immunity protein [Lactococcus lactis]MQQ81610.1 bacteriocin immunity protein [Lactococcus lactis]